MIPDIRARIYFESGGGTMLDVINPGDVDFEIMAFVTSVVKENCLGAPAGKIGEQIANRHIQETLMSLVGRGDIWYSEYAGKWLVPRTRRLFDWRMEK